MTTTTISLTSLVKEKLNTFKETEEITSFSDAVNLLLERDKMRKHYEEISR